MGEFDMVVKSASTYKVKVTTTTVSTSMPRAAAGKVAKAARAEIAKRGVRGAKVSIIKA
jgi:hypothetical protein